MSISYYDENSQDFFNNTVDVDLSNIYQEFLPLLSPNALILDAGCGSGRDAKHFHSLNYQVTAFDASEGLAKTASKHTGLNVLHASFQTFTCDKQFDAIWACASLLHVASDELNDVFCRLSGLLNTGGVFYCSFKYGDEMSERGGRTFTNLNETLLSEKLTNSQLSVTKTWVTGDQRPDRADEKWLNAILTKQA